MSKIMSMNTLNTQLIYSSMLAWNWCRELNKITWELDQKKKQLKNHKSLNNLLEQKWQSNVLEKHKNKIKIKNKKSTKNKKCSKNENTKKQNETLKAWSGTETGSFWKNQFDYGFQLFLELGLVLVPISIFLNDRTNGVIPT